MDDKITEDFIEEIIMFCPNCGVETESSGQFCGSCGTNLETLEVVFGTLLPRVGFVDAIKLGFSNYFKFSGRSRRSEYWFWTLFVWLGSFVFVLLDSLVGSGVFFVGFWLGILIPCFAVGARRLHDNGRSGWWQLLFFAPFGWVVLLVWWAGDSEKLPNKHGPNPKYGS